MNVPSSAACEWPWCREPARWNSGYGRFYYDRHIDSVFANQSSLYGRLSLQDVAPSRQTQKGTATARKRE